MAVKVYNATVKYPASPEPYDKGYGPSHNVRLAFDDPSAPKSDGKGEFNVYKKSGTRDADYMLTMRAGDKVLVAWNERDGKGWYDFVIPEDFKGYAAPATKPTTQATAVVPTAIEWMAPDDTFWEIWDHALEMEAKKVNSALDVAHSLFGAHSLSYSHDDITRIGIEMYRKASAHAKPGQALPSVRTTDIDKDTSLLLMVDPDNMVSTLLGGIMELSDGFYSMPGLKNTLKDMGLSSKDITDQDSCLLFAHVAWDYADMINAGAEESVALNAVAERHGLAIF